MIHFVRSFSRDSVQVVRSPDALKIVSNFPPMAHFPETDSTVYQAQNTLFVSLSSSSAAFWRPAPWARRAAAARGRPGRSPDGAGRGGDGADQAPEVRLRDVDLQRGDLWVERPQRGRGGLLLVVQRRELDLYRRAGEAEGAPARRGQRALGQRGERRPARRAQGLALPCAPTRPNRAPMRVLGSRDKAGRARTPTRPPPHPCPRPRQHLVDRSRPGQQQQQPQVRAGVWQEAPWTRGNLVSSTAGDRPPSPSRTRVPLRVRTGAQRSSPSEKP